MTQIEFEDPIRNMAEKILGFDIEEPKIKQGTGQIYTFNQLGFTGNNNRPDGWYLPDDKSQPAIILEVKAKKYNLYDKKFENELLKNIKIVNEKYNKVIGILYNGEDIRVFKNQEEVSNCAKTLQNKSYYISLYNNSKIDKQRIYALTKSINDCLHTRFGVKNLYHRMIFTACALVAVKEGAILAKDMDYSLFHQSILNQINKSLQDDKKRNSKLNLLGDIYSKIEMNSPDNRTAIDDFIGWIKEISEYVTSDNWNGEDVMGIFFNEFNRYKKKSENGQIFTPDHITSFMYKILDCNKNDRILDATCGSGAFLVKSMCNMIKEVGGINTEEAAKIKSEQLYGIEWDKEIFALACANMLIHKDGKTNLEQMDTRTQEACDWIADKKITKVLMNPPYERKYGCMKIVQNVLDSVPLHTKCAFILPDKKLEKSGKDEKYGNKLLKKHTLKQIIKLPENLFFGVGVTTSIFIFESGIPQNNNTIQCFYIEDDGLETVKNQGRQDIKNRWDAIENKWVEIIKNPLCEEAKKESEHIQSIKPLQHLSYQKPETVLNFYEEDFIKTMINFLMFEEKIDVSSLKNAVSDKIIYLSSINKKDNEISIDIKGD